MRVSVAVDLHVKKVIEGVLKMLAFTAVLLESLVHQQNLGGKKMTWWTSS